MRTLAAVLFLTLAVAAPASSRVAAKQALLRHGWIYVMRADGTRLRALPNPGRRVQFNPAWSPDGRRLAFAASAGFPQYQLYTVTADGKNRRALTSEEDPGSSSAPSWAPDGRWIAYTLEGDRYNPQPPSIMTVSADGRSSRRVVSPGWDPAWSPDGRTIAYTGARGELRLVDADGSRDRVFAEPAAGLTLAEAAWSPDGSRLAYVVSNATLTVSYVVVASVDGSHTRSLNDGISREWSPTWSPNGRRLALVRRGRSGGPRIITVAPDGTGGRTVRRLPERSTAQVSWSSRNEIAFSFARAR